MSVAANKACRDKCQSTLKLVVLCSRLFSCCKKGSVETKTRQPENSLLTETSFPSLQPRDGPDISFGRTAQLLFHLDRASSMRAILRLRPSCDSAYPQNPHEARIQSKNVIAINEQLVRQNESSGGQEHLEIKSHWPRQRVTVAQSHTNGTFCLVPHIDVAWTSSPRNKLHNY